MTIQGRIKDGVVVLQNGSTLPDGTQVTVRPVNRTARKAPSRAAKPLGRRKLLKHAGKAKGLPPDAARNLDHYLYGHAKK